ncbi:MAG: hypothetical protein LPJ91_04250 [Pseudazoarcus pumilus]|nr:hypothetical protein [Pseudazoarcus pumilus]
MSAMQYEARPELALAAVMQLMSRFPARRSPLVADAVVKHLEVIAADDRLPGEVRDCAREMCAEWCGYRSLCAGDACAPKGIRPS